MGQSTNAILAFGIDLGEEIPKWVREMVPQVTDEALEEDFSVLQAALEEIGFTIEMHCSDSYPMYVLAIDGSVSMAYRGSPQKVSVPDPAPPEWFATWKAHVPKAGLSKGKPGWLLFSWWA